MDFISGSYDPGGLYLFRGRGKGKYSSVENIRDESGQDVVHHPEEFRKYLAVKDEKERDTDENINLRVASFGSWPAADGKSDVLDRGPVKIRIYSRRVKDSLDNEFELAVKLEIAPGWHAYGRSFLGSGFCSCPNAPAA